MKKRIIATILAVAMTFSVCTIASAAEPFLADDFEGTQLVGLKEWWGTAGESTIEDVEGPAGTTTKAWQLVNTSWGIGNMGTVLTGLDAEKTYKFTAWVKGDWAYLDLRNPVIPDDPATEDVNESSFNNLSTLSSRWKQVEAVFTGVTNVDMVFQIQSAFGYYNGTAWMDDFMVVEIDPSEEPSLEPVPTATPEPVPDATSNPEDDETPTLAPPVATKSPKPTKSPTPTPTPTPAPSATAKPNYGGDFEYVLKNNDEVEITKYIGNKSFVDIPGKIINRRVTSIGDSAFKDNEIVQSVIFPDTLEEIGKQAFESCDLLNNVSFKENLKIIGWSAFLNCPSLSMVIIPQSVNNIGEYAFGYEDSHKQVLGFTISGFSNTAAEEYALDNGLNFLNLGSSTNEKKSVKFTKKSVKIKKGKKATLKVKLTGTKKATFSVDKKGKKVVKLMKKKAKSVVVVGKKKGKATITAKAAGKKAKCKVTVR